MDGVAAGGEDAPLCWGAELSRREVCDALLAAPGVNVYWYAELVRTLPNR